MHPAGLSTLKKQNKNGVAKFGRGNELGQLEKPKRIYSWMDGWVDRWMGGKAVLRFAYSNQKYSSIFQ